MRGPASILKRVLLIAALQLAAGVLLCPNACMIASYDHAAAITTQSSRRSSCIILDKTSDRPRHEGSIHLAMQSVQTAPLRWAPQWVAMQRWSGRACEACKL